MAVMTIFTPLVFAGGVGVVTVATASQVSIVTGSVTQDYYGFGFTYSGSSVIGGTVTGTDLYDSSNGGLQYSISGLFHDAATVGFYVSIGDANGLRAFLFSGNDTINGSSGADILDAYTGTNVLNGNGGNDTLRGGNGVDSLIGGAGDDHYDIWGTGAVSIIEDSGGGNDTVTISLGSFALPDHVETLLLQTSAENGAGNSLDNLITGNSLDNRLEGGAGNDTLAGDWGNDTLDGGTGNDVLQGGELNDTYIIDSLSDVISDVSGVDNVVAHVAGYVLAADIENLVLGASIAAGTGNGLANTLTGNALDNVLDGAGGNDSIFGDSGSDTLLGGDGNDTLNGGAGIDHLVGGDGNDVYLIDDAVDALVEAANGGIDTVLSPISYSLGANIENLTLTGDVAINGTGNALSNAITGNSAANILDGGAGADTLNGGLGDDIYHVDDAGDVITDTGGVDTIVLTGSYSLANAPTVENVTLAGSVDINATGNALNNIITGNDGRNILTAVGGGDRLFGMGGMDTLIGTDSSETIDGGSGADSMVGGLGFDTYYVDDPNDIIVEMDTGTSDYLDRVFSSVSYVLPQYVEILTLTGDAPINGSGKGSITGNSAGNYLTGSSFVSDELYGMGGNDTLDGGAGADKMFGGTGDDLYFIDDFTEAVHPAFLAELPGEGNDTIVSAVDNVILPANFEVLVMLPGAFWGTGNALNNVIIGHATASVLDGGAGADTMIGGGGNDEYRVDNTGDVVDELPDEGHDKVLSSASFSLAGTQVEELWLSLGNDTAPLDGTGNELANFLRGNSGNNFLNGGGGNDTLDGWFFGVDTLAGGSGDDLYVLWQNDDVILELSGEGNDTIETSASFSLAALPHVENLRADPSATVNLTGNDLNNILQGNPGTNVLDGGIGNDSLYGDHGNDTLYGDNGDDLLDGGAGYDTIDGGNGTDTADYSGAAAGISVALWNNTVANDGQGGSDTLVSIETVLGSNFNDTLVGSSAANRFEGADGDDRLFADAGNDTLYGGNGNDTLAGGAGNDTLDGGAGVDVADYFSVGAGISVTLWNTTVANDGQGGSDTLISIETVLGSNFNDTLVGSAVANRLEGAGGNDLLFADAGNDTLLGGDGDDRLNGGTGNDTLDGGAGVDVADYFSVGAGISVTLWNTTVANDGQGGSDALISIETVLGSNFNDTLVGSVAANRFEGADGDDRLFADAGNDTLFGGNGNDTLAGGAGNDTLDGGAGVDVADYFSVGAGISVTLWNTTVANDGQGGSDALISIETVLGSNFNDTLVGSVAANRFEGADGDDRLFADAGNDTLFGGNGNDTLAGGAGNDTLDGGAGVDVADYFSVGAGISVTLWNTTVANDGQGGSDALISIETVLGSNFNDTLVGSVAANRFEGADGDDRLFADAGNDTLFGGNGNDTLAGGAGNDTLDGGAGVDVADYFSVGAGISVTLWNTTVVNDGQGGSDTLVSIETVLGSNFNDTLVGSVAANRFEGADGNDLMFADVGADTLLGGGGNDVLSGGNGNDVMTGGTGQDSFRFDFALGAANIDQITDFVVDDTIQLENAVFTSLATPGALAAESFVSGAGVAALDLDDYILYDIGTGALYYDADANGSGLAQQFATLNGIPSILASDFLVI